MWACCLSVDLWLKTPTVYSITCAYDQTYQGWDEGAPSSRQTAYIIRRQNSIKCNITSNSKYKILFKKSRYLNCIIGKLTEAIHHNSLNQGEGWDLNRVGKPLIHFLEKCRKPPHRGNTMLNIMTLVTVPNWLPQVTGCPKSGRLFPVTPRIWLSPQSLSFTTHFSAHCLRHRTPLMSFCLLSAFPTTFYPSPSPTIPMASVLQ